MLREWLNDIVLIRPAKQPGRALSFWLVLAAASVVLATWVARDEGGMMLDLHELRSWLRAWMVDGHSPYTVFAPDADYPPMAFLLLAPLGLPSGTAVASWFVPLAVASVILASWMMLRWLTRELRLTLSASEVIALIAMVLAMGTTRRLIWHGQTVAVSIIFGMLALQWAPQRRVAAGVALALCAFKPQIGLGFALALLVTQGAGSIVALSTAAVVTALSFVVFATTLALPVGEVAASWFHNIATIYTGPDRVRELLGLRYLIEDVTRSSSLALVIWVTSAVAALVVIARATGASRAHRSIACLMWGLVFLPHQLYDGLLAVPALWWLMWPEAGGGSRSRPMATALLATLVMLDVFDISGVMREIARQVDSTALFGASQWLPPLRMIALTALVLPMRKR